jgi:hypothetical protein
VTTGLCLFIPINYLTILSLVAIGGGLYFFFFGFQLLARKRLLLATPTSRIRSAAMGLVEVNGVAAGPYTVFAPITGKPCFLYRTVVWQQRSGKKQEWEKVADETLHLPFFIDDSTGQLLIEPLGADLDLHRDFREEYDASFFSLNLEYVPPRISVFLSRHGVVPGRRLRIEESSIKPQDALFVAGTLAENPGVQVRPFSPRTELQAGFAYTNDSRLAAPRNTAPDDPLGHIHAQQIIRLENGATPSTSHEMTQQERIAAALTRAGITKPEAWSAAGVPYQTVEIDENAPLSSATSKGARDEASPNEAQSSGFHLTPPAVLMKGDNDPTFVISFRSQKEFALALGWKSSAMIWGGAASTLLGLYMLLAQTERL